MYIYGKNVATEYLKEKNKIKKIYLSKNFKDNIDTNNIPVKYMEKYEMDKMVDGLHQGIILEVEDYKYADIDDIINIPNDLIVLLDLSYSGTKPAGIISTIVCFSESSSP